MYRSNQRAYGNTRLVDNCNRITIPVGLRNGMDICEGDEVRFKKINDDTIELTIHRYRRRRNNDSI